MAMTNIQFKNGTTLNVPTLVVTGDLIVSGTTTSENAEQILTKGALTVINSDNEQLQATLMGTVIRTGNKDYAIVYEPWNEVVKLGVGTYNTEDNSFEFYEEEGHPIAVRDLGETDDGCLVSWDSDRFCLVKSPIEIKDNEVILNEVSNFYNYDSAAKLYGYYITSIDYNNKFLYVSETKPDNSVGKQYYDLGSITTHTTGQLTQNKPTENGQYYCNINIASNWEKSIVLTYKGDNKFQFDALPDDVNTLAKLKSEIQSMEKKLSNGERYAEVIHYISVDATANGANTRNEISEPIGVEIPLDYRFAFGWNVEAKGSRSFAAGEKTVAQGENSAAFGRASIANKGAFAAGYGNYALGNYSTALGGQNTASGIASFAEGNYTEASGTNAHSEGRSTIAKGHSSHAEGFGTITGDGTPTIANDKINGYFAHAEGTGTNAIGTASHTEGCGTVTGNGTPVINAVDNASGNEDMGLYAHAEGNGTKAKGNNSHAEGRGSKANAIAAHAEGWSTEANGVRSHSEGSGTFADGISSHAEGHQTKATGQGAHSEGMKLDDNHFTTASGKASHAEGVGTVASNEGAHSEGRETQALGEASHAEGRETIASGVRAHAEGYATHATKQNTHAEGTSTKALGHSGHSEGHSSIAGPSDNAPTPIGDNTAGFFAHAEGNGTWASGNSSHSEGKGTTAEAQASHAEGAFTHALGLYSHTEGNSTNAHGERSHAEGSQTNAYTFASHTEGVKSQAGGTTAPEVHTATTAGYFAHAEGNGTWARGNSSHAEGKGTIAKGLASHAGGIGTIAEGQAQTVIGKYSAPAFMFDEQIPEDNILFKIGDGESDENRHNALYVTSDMMVAPGAIFSGEPSAETQVVTQEELAMQLESLTSIGSSEDSEIVTQVGSHSNDIQLNTAIKRSWITDETGNYYEADIKGKIYLNGDVYVGDDQLEDWINKHGSFKPGLGKYSVQHGTSIAIGENNIAFGKDNVIGGLGFKIQTISNSPADGPIITLDNTNLTDNEIEVICNYFNDNQPNFNLNISKTWLNVGKIIHSASWSSEQALIFMVNLSEEFLSDPDNFNLNEDNANPNNILTLVDNLACEGLNNGVRSKLVSLINNQMVIGAYNKDNPDALFMIGNGTDNENRSNAFEITKDTAIIHGQDILSRILPEVTDVDNNKILQVSNGEWALNPLTKTTAFIVHAPSDNFNNEEIYDAFIHGKAVYLLLDTGECIPCSTCTRVAAIFNETKSVDTATSNISIIEHIIWQNNYSCTEKTLIQDTYLNTELAPLIVTVSGNTPSHTSQEIYEATIAGKDVYLHLWGTTYIALARCTEEEVRFSYSYTTTATDVNGTSRPMSVTANYTIKDNVYSAGSITVPSQQYVDAMKTLIVTVNGTTPSSTNAEIYSAVTSGRAVYLQVEDGTHVLCSKCTETLARFEMVNTYDFTIDDTRHSGRQLYTYIIQNDVYKTSQAILPSKSYVDAVTGGMECVGSVALAVDFEQTTDGDLYKLGSHQSYRPTDEGFEYSENDPIALLKDCDIFKIDLMGYYQSYTPDWAIYAMGVIGETNYLYFQPLSGTERFFINAFLDKYLFDSWRDYGEPTRTDIAITGYKLPTA